MNDFYLYLVKPTRYDDAGYPIRWRRSMLPANSLACLYALAQQCKTEQVLGPDVTLHIEAFDEANHQFDGVAAFERMRRQGGKGLLALVGVQSNQFPRALDLARDFRELGGQVCIGGFHVSGILSMLEQPDAALDEALEMGVSLFAGEAEAGRFTTVLTDAYAERLQPIYNYLKQLPDLEGAPQPFLPPDMVARTFSHYSCFDLGRGCPYTCTFCSIINVQGRSSRFRSADDLEGIIRANHAAGIHRFFITDDNLARNRNWENLFDRLIALREKEGIKLRLLIQVDTMAHRVSRFIDKAVKAGVDQVFIGMESIREENLKEIGKSQNRIDEYRSMLLAWKKYPVVVTAGYIIGFPADTPERIAEDVEILKARLPLDVIYFTYLTPLPGSHDHRDLTLAGDWLEPDLNQYDLNHRVTRHPHMSDREWEGAYEQAWRSFYTYDHMVTILRRMVVLGSNKKLSTIHRLIFYREFRRQFGVHPLEGGFGRRYDRNERRSGMSRENKLFFLLRRSWQQVRANVCGFVLYLRLRLALYRILRDPTRTNWRDESISP